MIALLHFATYMRQPTKHFPIWISYWNLSSYIPVAPFLDRIEFLRPDLNFFRRSGFPRNLWKPNALLMLMLCGFKEKIYYMRSLWYEISGAMDLKDTKSVISLNFLKGAGLKCPINHYEWRTPKSPLTKRFLIWPTQSVCERWSVDMEQAVRDVAADRTGQKATDCRCYRLPTYPLHRSQIFSTAHTTNFFRRRW